MANEWMSSLPSAWKPQDPQTLTNAFSAGAQLPLVGAEAANLTANAQSTNQQTQARAGMQQAFAGAIRSVPVIDGDGNPVLDPSDPTGTTPLIKHEFDDDLFKSQLQDNPGAADAYTEYVKTAYPQMQLEAKQELYDNAAQVDDNGNPTGGLDPNKASAYIQQHPEMAAYLTQALQEATKAQYSNAADIANYKQQLSGNGVQEQPIPEGPQASPTSAVGQTQMRPTQFGQSTNLFVPKTAADVPTDPLTRAALIKGLQGEGVTGANPAWTNTQIADAMNQVAKNAVMSHYTYDSQHPENNVGNWRSLQQQAPGYAQQEWSKLIPGGTALAGSQQQQRVTGYNFGNQQKTTSANLSTIDSVVKDFKLPNAGVLGPTIEARQQKAQEVRTALQTNVTYQNLADNIAQQIRHNGLSVFNTKQFESDLASLANQAGTAVAASTEPMRNGATLETGTQASDLTAMFLNHSPLEAIKAFVQGSDPSAVAAAIEHSGKLIFDRSAGNTIASLRGNAPNANDVYKSIVHQMPAHPSLGDTFVFPNGSIGTYTTHGWDNGRVAH